VLRRESAELLESHLSYPILAYYRSQYEQQSWLAGLTTILDVAALIMVGIGGTTTRPARLAFAIARHGAADLSHILGTRPPSSDPECLAAADLVHLRALLAEAGGPLREGPEADTTLTHLWQMYEPFVSALADRLLMPLPPWLPTPGARMSGRSRRGERRCSPPNTMRWTARRMSKTCGVALAMFDGFLGGPSMVRTPDVAHAPEAFTAVCTSPEHDRAVPGNGYV